VLADMVIVFTCPDCNEANAFACGIPKRGEQLHCSACGGTIVAQKELLDEFEAIMEGLRESIERFVEQ
jgi:transcription elongation factor Elf1